MVIKKLSKTPKLNTILLEMIVRVLNMPIELKVITTTQKCLKKLITSYEIAHFE